MPVSVTGQALPILIAVQQACRTRALELPIASVQVMQVTHFLGDLLGQALGPGRQPCWKARSAELAAATVARVQLLA